MFPLIASPTLEDTEDEDHYYVTLFDDQPKSVCDDNPRINLENEGGVAELSWWRFVLNRRLRGCWGSSIMTKGLWVQGNNSFFNALVAENRFVRDWRAATRPTLERIFCPGLGRERMICFRGGPVRASAYKLWIDLSVAWWLLLELATYHPGMASYPFFQITKRHWPTFEYWSGQISC